MTASIKTASAARDFVLGFYSLTSDLTVAEWLLYHGVSRSEWSRVKRLAGARRVRDGRGNVLSVGVTGLSIVSASY